jgi:glycosyltransferase involved in cell wall biosynthesis
MVPEGRIKFVDQYAYAVGMISQHDVAALYTAADVLLATSYGEGFGLPVVEAQACGTPVIVSDFTAQPELVGGGWIVKVQPWWDHAHGAYFGVPLVGLIIKALEEAYERRGDPGLKAQAIAKAAEYDADLVYDTYWRPILAEMESMLLPRKQRRRK